MKIASFNRFDLKLTEEQIDDCHHQGSCDADVAYHQSKVDFSKITDDMLRAELKEYGAWSDVELNNRDENERRILWIAAGNIQDEMSLEHN